MKSDWSVADSWNSGVGDGRGLIDSWIGSYLLGLFGLAEVSWAFLALAVYIGFAG